MATGRLSVYGGTSKSLVGSIAYNVKISKYKNSHKESKHRHTEGGKNIEEATIHIHQSQQYWDIFLYSFSQEYIKWNFYVKCITLKLFCNVHVINFL